MPTTTAVYPSPSAVYSSPSATYTHTKTNNNINAPWNDNEYRKDANDVMVKAAKMVYLNRMNWTATSDEVWNELQRAVFDYIIKYGQQPAYPSRAMLAGRLGQYIEDQQMMKVMKVIFLLFFLCLSNF